MGGKVEYYPLTHPQKGIWYTEKLYPGTSIAIISATVRIAERVDYEKLEKAINIFIEKNDGARIRITERDGEPLQYVPEYRCRKLDLYDFSEAGVEKLYKWDEEQTRVPLDVFEDELLYFAMLKIGEAEGGFYIKTHHLISDAWSMYILAGSIMEYYAALKGGKNVCVENRPSYLHFIERERQYRNSRKFETDEQYWNEKLSNWTEVTALKARKANSYCSKAKRRAFLVPKKLLARMRSFCTEKGLSEYALFFAALAMYINRVTGREDIVIGTPLLNRTGIREKETVGMFVSAAVPLRIYINGDMNFRTFVEHISREILSILRHQKYPYDLLVKKVREQTGSPAGLFDIVLSYQNTKFNREKYEVPFNTRWHFNGHQIEALLININDTDNSGSIILDYDYLEDLFHSTEIEFIHQHIINLLWHALDNPDKRISRLEMLSEQEKRKILCEFNKTGADYDRTATVHKLFEEQAERTPGRIAVSFEDRSLTYGELNGRSNRLARVLRGKGVGPEAIVGVVLEKSPEMIIATLAVLKAGGAYLPIDPDYPRERVEFTLRDSSAKILLTQKRLAQRFGFAGSVVLVDGPEADGMDPANLDNVNKPEDMVYVIYTSGSTGRPKGVILEHKNVVRLLFNTGFQFQFDENDIWTMFHSYCFDFSVWEMYGALLYGGRLIVVPKAVARDTGRFLTLLKERRVTVLNQTPAAFYNLLEAETDCDDRQLCLRYVIFGGEALKPGMLTEFSRRYPDTRLVNMYGITETTVHVTFKELSEEDMLSGKSNIGRPIPTLKTYIMDGSLNLLPINVPGEICVGGEGVARGYLSRPGLTAERFVENPFVPGERLYRSGDLGRWFSKGDIEYLGRIDGQVKIRGFRVELGEIENVLNKFPGVSGSVVTSRRSGSEKECLCAYLAYQGELPVSKLREHLLSELPDYMLPSYFVRLDRLPLTSNGKLNRKELPDPAESFSSGAEYVPPENEIEKELAKIWSELLKTDKIGIDDNFFNIGGDSLTVIRMLTRLYKYNWDLTTPDFYKYPTIRQLSEKIKGNVTGASDAGPLDIQTVEAYEEVSCAAMAAETPCRVLLTGATGFLGMHVLEELLKAPDTVVHCLIRDTGGLDAETKLRRLLHFYFGGRYAGLIGKRIFIVRGDIASERLGLSEKEYALLGGSLDSVVHSAALVKYFGEYKEFERINVTGTERVIDMAREYGLKLNHISTVGISGSYLVDNSGAVKAKLTEKDFYVGQNYADNAYVRSKFEAENSVLKAMKQGLAASIFRMGNLTGRHADGHFQQNAGDNAFYGSLKSLIQLRAVPEQLLETELEFTPVDLAGKAVVMIAGTERSAGRVFHITNHNSLKLGEVMELLNTLDIRINVLGNEDFKRYIEEVSADAAKREALSGIIGDMGRTGELNYKIAVETDSEITRRYLKLLGFEWPDVDIRYIGSLIGYLKRIKYLN